MARKTGYHVLHKTPEEIVALSAKSTEEKERQENNQKNKQENKQNNKQENKKNNTRDRKQNNKQNRVKCGRKNRQTPHRSSRAGDNATIFDDVFKTILEKLSELAIPLINEAFGTAYPPDTKVVRCADEYHTRRGKRLVDFHFRIGKKRYHLECQIRRDGRMIIRMWEYDATIALEHAQKKDGRYRISLPHSCILQLRGKHQYDRMEMDIVLPDGQKFTYSVPVLWLSDYTSDKIFQKHLFFLLPFYIIRYEKQIHRLETDKKYLDEMLAEYREIEAYLEKELLEKDRETAYRDMIELINRIADYVMRDSEKVKQEVEGVMGGRVLKLQTDYLIEQGEKIGEKRGEERGIKRINNLYNKLFEDGRSADLRKSLTDEVFRRKLLKEYGL